MIEYSRKVILQFNREASQELAKKFGVVKMTDWKLVLGDGDRLSLVTVVADMKGRTHTQNTAL